MQRDFDLNLERSLPSLPLWRRLVTDQQFRYAVRGLLGDGVVKVGEAPHTSGHRTKLPEHTRFYLWLLRSQGRVRSERWLDVRTVAAQHLAFGGAVSSPEGGGNGGPARPSRPTSAATSIASLGSSFSSVGSSPAALREIERKVQQSVREWWQGLPKIPGDGASSTKRVFVSFNLLLEAALLTVGKLPDDPAHQLMLPHEDLKAAEALFDVDWAQDCPAGKRMREPDFISSMAAILRTFCDTREPVEHLGFLQTFKPYLFDSNGLLRSLRQAPTPQPVGMDAILRRRQPTDLEEGMTVEEKRFLHDKPPLRETQQKLLQSSPALENPRPVTPVTPKRSKEAPSTVPSAISAEYLQEVSHVLQNCAADDPYHVLAEMQREASSIAKLLPPHTRVVPLAQFHKRRYGRQKKGETFRLETVIMERTAQQIGTTTPAEPTPLLGYLRDGVIKPKDLHRISEVNPQSYDTFLDAIETAAAAAPFSGADSPVSKRMPSPVRERRKRTPSPPPARPISAPPLYPVPTSKKEHGPQFTTGIPKRPGRRALAARRVPLGFLARALTDAHNADLGIPTAHGLFPRTLSEPRPTSAPPLFALHSRDSF